MTAAQFRKQIAAALLAALVLSSLAARHADAQLITFELRPTSDSQVASPGDMVTFDIYAVVRNNNGNQADDGFNFMHTALVSVETPGAPLGNLSPLTVNGALIDPGPSQPGSQIDLDGNPDLEVGGTDPTNVFGWVSLFTGTDPKFGTGTTGDAAFRLGSSSWTYSGGGVMGGATSINLSLRLRTTGLPTQQQTNRYVVDGVAHVERSDNPNIAVGAPIVIGWIPEPTSVALLAAGGLMVLRRRRS